MTAFLGALVAALIIPLVLGFPAVCGLRLATGIRRIAWSGALGLAMLILILRMAQYVVPLGGAIWWLTPLLVIGIGYGWSRRAVRTGFRRDCASLTWLGGSVLVLCVLALAAALNLPILLHHVIAFDGTPNHDSIFYVLNARWMQTHRFFDAPSFQPDHPLQVLAKGFFGSGLGYRRVGAEAFLAYTSELIGKDPIYAYNAVMTAGAIWASLSGFLILPAGALRRLRGGLRGGWLFPVFFCTPALLFAVFNSNYACIFGVVFFAAYIAISLWQPRSRGRRRIAAVLLLAALAATYPELIPLAWLALAAAIASTLFLRSSLRTAIYAGMQITGEVLITAVVFVWLTVSAYYTIANAHADARARPSPWPDVYAHLPPLKYAIALLTTSRGFAEWLPLPLCGLALLAVAWLAASALAGRDTRRPILFGIGTSLVALGAYIFAISFYYGEIKIAEYFSVFVAAVGVLGYLSGNLGGGVRRIAGSIALATSFLLALGGSAFWVRESLSLAALKHVTPEMVALAERMTQLPANSTVAIGPNPWPFYYAMWFPYLAPKARVVFDYGPHDRGYFAAYLDSQSRPAYDTADFRIESTDKPVSMGGEKVLGVYGDFRLVKTSPVVITSGAYKPEKSFRWLGQVVTVHIPPDTGRFLDLVLADRYKPAHAMESLAIAQAGFTCNTGINTKHAAISIPVHGPDITLRFGDPAVSPSQFGRGDTRKLTFRLLSMDVSNSPPYAVVNCTATASP